MEVYYLLFQIVTNNDFNGMYPSFVDLAFKSFCNKTAINYKSQTKGVEFLCLTKYPIGYIIIIDENVFLSKSDQVRFAEVYRGILKYGFEYPRVIFKVIDRKL